MKQVLWLAACVVVLISAPFHAQTKPASTDMEILRQKIKADKKLLVSTNLELTEAEARPSGPCMTRIRRTSRPSMPARRSS